MKERGMIKKIMRYWNAKSVPGSRSIYYTYNICICIYIHIIYILIYVYNINIIYTLARRVGVPLARCCGPIARPPESLFNTLGVSEERCRYSHPSYKIIPLSAYIQYFGYFIYNNINIYYYIILYIYISVSLRVLFREIKRRVPF